MLWMSSVLCPRLIMAQERDYMSCECFCILFFPYSLRCSTLQLYCHNFFLLNSWIHLFSFTLIIDLIGVSCVGCVCECEWMNWMSCVDKQCFCYENFKATERSICVHIMMFLSSPANSHSLTIFLLINVSAGQCLRQSEYVTKKYLWTHCRRASIKIKMKNFQLRLQKTTLCTLHLAFN